MRRIKSFVRWFFGYPAAVISGLFVVALPLWLPVSGDFPNWLERAQPFPPTQPSATHADRISLSALIATILVAVFSIIPNLRSIERSSRYAHYSELDHMYFEILKLALVDPSLRNPDHLPDSKRAEYNVYAFMVWNFIETIHDRCIEDATLRATWKPVILAEARIHADWFEHECVPYETKAPTFCLQFCDFVWRMRQSSPNHRSPLDRYDDWKYRDDIDIRECLVMRDRIFQRVPG